MLDSIADRDSFLIINQGNLSHEHVCAPFIEFQSILDLSFLQIDPSFQHVHSYTRSDHVRVNCALELLYNLKCFQKHQKSSFLVSQLQAHSCLSSHQVDHFDKKLITEETKIYLVLQLLLKQHFFFC